MEVTVLLLTCCYKDKEFIRIGFYVNNDYGDNLELKEKPPVQVCLALRVVVSAHSMCCVRVCCGQPDVSRLVRTILADRPRVTRFQIPWDEQAPEVTAALRAASAIEQKSDSAIGRNGSDSSMHTADFDSVVSAGPGSAATPSLVSDAAASLSDSMMDTSV
jgi:histone chaperone ASF1